jgi:anaerobic selenocysteine-containing dehydrogenase
VLPEDLVTGIENWYASVCRQCPAGCGIIGRVIEGRARKLEGNRFSPINEGKSCARGQAGLQVLYHPDRIPGPMRRVGPRGSGQYEPLSWDQALDQLVILLRGTAPREVVFLTEPLRGHLGLVVQRFVEAYGAQHLALEPVEETVLRAAMKRVFGQDRLPEFDIANTSYLLSFGSNFLETWLSPVRYNRGYGNFRQGEGRQRGTLVQVEPRFSMTAGNADVWVPVKPGTEGVFAMSMAYVIISQGLAEAEAAQAMTGGEGDAALERFNPEAVSELVGVSAEKIQELARDFATHRPSLAIGGGSAAAHTNGLFNLIAIYSLNYLVGSVGKKGGVLFNPPPPLDLPQGRGSSFLDWQVFTNRIYYRDPAPVRLALIHNANPVYGLPQGVNFADALQRVDQVVSFSSFVDETTALADLILPDNTYLESWGSDLPDPGPGFQMVSMQQPLVRPFFNTRQLGDVLLAAAEELGTPALAAALPWSTLLDAIKEGTRQLQGLNRGTVQDADFDRFWVKLLQEGGWSDDKPEGRSTAPIPVPPQLPREPVVTEGLSEDYPFSLVPFISLTLTDGRGAHLPWLQAVPDPVSTVVWQTWVEMNRGDARRLDIKEGDVLRIESPAGVIEALAYPHPAMPPGVVGIPFGQGHTAYTRYGQRRGANVFALLAQEREPETGALAWAGTHVRIRKAGRNVRVPKFEGVVIPVQISEEHPIIEVTRG